LRVDDVNPIEALAREEEEEGDAETAKNSLPRYLLASLAHQHLPPL